MILTLISLVLYIYAGFPWWGVIIIGFLAWLFEVEEFKGG